MTGKAHATRERGMTDDNILDDLELELRMLPGVRAAGFDEHEDVLFVQLHLAGDAQQQPEPMSRRASRRGMPNGPVAVEIVRWRTRAPGVAAEPEPEPYVDLTLDVPIDVEIEVDADSFVHAIAEGRDAEADARDAPAAPARGARVPRHRRARGAPDPRRSPHDRPGARVARARRRGRSHHRSRARPRRADRPAREVGRARSTATATVASSSPSRSRRRTKSRRCSTDWRPARARSTPPPARRSTR